MTRIPVHIAAIADAALTVAIGLALPLLFTIASWLISGGFQTTLFDVPFTIAAAVWALGLGGGVGFSISPETYPSLGIAEPFVFVVSIAPLAITALIAWMAWRAGDRLSDDDAPWAGIAASIAAFALAAWLSLTFATSTPFRIDVSGAVTVGTITWAVMLLIGVRVWEYLPWHNWLADRFDEVAELAIRAVRIAVALVVGTLGLATAFLLLALVTSMGRVIGLMESLQLGISGVIGIGLLQLLYLPTLIVWASAWMLGPGIELGEGSLANLGGTEAGPLPVVPLLGMLPEGSSPYLWAVIALPVVLAAVVSLIARSRIEGIDERVWWERLLPPVGGALIAAVTLAVFAHLSRGAIGPGRLTEFGPQPWWMLLVAFALFFVGGAIGAFLPLESVAVSSTESAESAGGPDSGDGAGTGRAATSNGADRTARSGRSPGSRRSTGVPGSDDAEGEAGSEPFTDGPDPRTQPHLIPFQRILGRVLGDRRDEHDDDDTDETDSDEDQYENGDAADGHDLDSVPLTDDEDTDTRWPRAKPASPYARARPRLELRDAVHRPDEPDIYADIDLNDDQR